LGEGCGRIRRGIGEGREFRETGVSGNKLVNILRRGL